MATAPKRRDDDDDEPAKDSELEESRMPFLSHLRELRDRVRNAALCFCAAFVVCWYFGSEIFDWLLQPLKNVWDVEKLGPFAKVLANAYYLDVGLARFVSGPATSAARFLSEGIDRDTIDGAVNGIGRAFQRTGGGLRKVQTGLVRNYALAIVLGIDSTLEMNRLRVLVVVGIHLVERSARERRVGSLLVVRGPRTARRSRGGGGPAIALGVRRSRASESTRRSPGARSRSGLAAHPGRSRTSTAGAQ